MTDILTNDYQPKLSLSEAAQEYANLRQTIKQLGILKRACLFYAILIPMLVGAYCATAYAIFITDDYAWLTLWAFGFAFLMVQIGGLMHDAAHQAIFVSPFVNKLAGIFFAAVGGLNYYGWNYMHNLHHAHPNQKGKDTDIDLPFSFNSESYDSQKGIRRLLRRYQAWLYLPVGCLAFYNILFERNIHMLFLKAKNGFKFGLLAEIFLSALCLFLIYILPFLIFVPSKAIFLLILIPVINGFYIANIFAPNHKGMPELSSDAKMSYLEQQIITTRNVRPGFFTDFLYLSLNYQIEHHLFPECPRNKLKLLTPHIQAMCHRIGLPFSVVTPMESIRIILHELSAVAESSENELRSK